MRNYRVLEYRTEEGRSWGGGCVTKVGMTDSIVSSKLLGW